MRGGLKPGSYQLRAGAIFLAFGRRPRHHQCHFALACERPDGRRRNDQATEPDFFRLSGFHHTARTRACPQNAPLADEFSTTQLTRRIVVVKAWNQASPVFAHPESRERQGFLNGRYEVDFDNACIEGVRRSRESAHDVNDDYDTTSLMCAVHPFNDSSDHARGS
jgi:hypothetical protein